MERQIINLNAEMTKFLDGLHHPLRKEMEQLRAIILSADSRLSENTKWNGPNYSCNKGDRITMKIQPPKQIQLIFHRGAKVQKQPSDKLIKDEAGLLVWKENDRAVATFKNIHGIEDSKQALAKTVKAWVDATA